MGWGEMVFSNFKNHRQPDFVIAIIVTVFATGFCFYMYFDNVFIKSKDIAIDSLERANRSLKYDNQSSNKKKLVLFIENDKLKDDFNMIKMSHENISKIINEIKIKNGDLVKIIRKNELKLEECNKYKEKTVGRFYSKEIDKKVSNKMKQVTEGIEIVEEIYWKDSPRTGESPIND